MVRKGASWPRPASPRPGPSRQSPPRPVQDLVADHRRRRCRRRDRRRPCTCSSPSGSAADAGRPASAADEATSDPAPDEQSPGQRQSGAQQRCASGDTVVYLGRSARRSASRTPARRTPSDCRCRSSNLDRLPETESAGCAASAPQQQSRARSATEPLRRSISRTMACASRSDGGDHRGEGGGVAPPLALDRPNDRTQVDHREVGHTLDDHQFAGRQFPHHVAAALVRVTGADHDAAEAARRSAALRRRRSHQSSRT